MTDKVDILLVEDNPDDADLALRAIRKNGARHTVVHLKDGEEAIDYIFGKGGHSGRTFEQFPKLILLDHKMPKIDGVEVLKQLKQDARTRMIPVVLMSSSNLDREMQKCYQLGVNSYVVKPVDFDDFVKIVADVCLYWLVINNLPH